MSVGQNVAIYHKLLSANFDFFYENVATFQLNLINVIPLYMTIELIVFYLLTALPHVFEVSKGDLRVGGRNRLITVLSRVHSQQHHQSLLGKGLQFDTFFDKKKTSISNY